MSKSASSQLFTVTAVMSGQPSQSRYELKFSGLSIQESQRSSMPSPSASANTYPGASTSGTVSGQPSSSMCML